MEQNQAVAMGDMGMDLYQKCALNTAVFQRVDYPLLALSEEVGEVMGKIAKYGRKNGMSAEQVILGIASANPEMLELRQQVEKEMGDVLWQWAVLASVLDMRPCKIAHENLMKLQDRQQRDVLNGEGDNR